MYGETQQVPGPFSRPGTHHFGIKGNFVRFVGSVGRLMRVISGGVAWLLGF